MMIILIYLLLLHKGHLSKFPMEGNPHYIVPQTQRRDPMMVILCERKGRREKEKKKERETKLKREVRRE